jgi:hypothetical protein
MTYTAIWSGLIDDVHTYEGSLTAEEVAELARWATLERDKTPRTFKGQFEILSSSSQDLRGVFRRTVTTIVITNGRLLGRNTLGVACAA